MENNEKTEQVKPPKTYNKLIIIVIVILTFLSVGSFSLFTSEQEKREEKQKNETVIKNENIAKTEQETKVIDYEIIKEDDTSYNNCVRKEYKAIVKKDASKEEIEKVLKDVFKKKEKESDKVFIYVYKNFQKKEVDTSLYAGRLFMDPDCEKSNDYKIDFDYWSLVHQNQ